MGGEKDTRIFCKALFANMSVSYCEYSCKGTDFAKRRCQGSTSPVDKRLILERSGKMPERVTCKYPGCETILSAANRSGYCRQHYNLDRPSSPHCKGCDKKMGYATVSGYCRNCLRALAADRKEKDRCLYPGCQERTHRGSGLCERHLKSKLNRRCSFPGCNKVLDKRNVVGRCKEHFSKRIESVSLNDDERALAKEGKIMLVMQMIYLRLLVPRLDSDVFEAIRNSTYREAGRTPPLLSEAQRGKVKREVEGA